MPDIRAATAAYEKWLGARVPLIAPDLARKHDAMRGDRFSFMRATYYRWAQLWPDACEHEAGAPRVLAVGDLHVDNFGTWRDAEGRLVWGVNDLDEAWRLPFTNDLIRLAVSARIAVEEHALALDADAAIDTILEGYREGLAAPPAPFVLAEAHPSAAPNGHRAPQGSRTVLGQVARVAIRDVARARRGARRAAPRDARPREPQAHPASHRGTRIARPAALRGGHGVARRADRARSETDRRVGRGVGGGQARERARRSTASCWRPRCDVPIPSYFRADAGSCDGSRPIAHASISKHCRASAMRRA